MKKRLPGLTLIEILLSIALIGIVVGVGLTLAYTYQSRTDLASAATAVAHTLRKAQTHAMAVDGDSQWGVKIQSGAITLFKGATYASRDTTLDETYTIPSTVSPSGVSEFIFSRFTGDPSATGTAILTGINSETKNITLYEKGRIEY